MKARGPEAGADVEAMYMYVSQAMLLCIFVYMYVPVSTQVGLKETDVPLFSTHSARNSCKAWCI